MPRVKHAAARAQHTVSAKPLLKKTLPGGRPWAAVYRNEHSYLVRFTEFVDFEISGKGTKILIQEVPGVSPHSVEHLYHNAALPLALSLQGKLVLHGSAVEIGDKAVAFLAESGRGKSTLAASFASNGFRFLTDDGLQIIATDGGYCIHPSHPSIRLWDDSCTSVMKSTTQPLPALDYTAKARFLADENFVFCTEDRALKHVYFLGDGRSENVSITPLSGQESFVEMIRHCFLLGIDEREILAENFQQIAELSRLPIFYNLDFPRDYDILDQVRETVANHTQPA